MTAFSRRKLGIIVNDLAGWTRHSRRRDDLELMAFLDAYYALCHQALTERDARVIKFMGDSCLAVVDPEALAPLVGELPALHQRIEALGIDRGLPLRPGTNVHLAEVGAGELGPAEHRRFDIVGSGVNHAFVMGGGPGIRISEPVYRALPNRARSGWNKYRPPATYSFAAGG